MTFSDFAHADHPRALPAGLFPLRVAAQFVDRMIASSRARRERNFVNRLRRLDAHLRRDLGLESAVLDALEWADVPEASRRRR